jgi:hypothetical protein
MKMKELVLEVEESFLNDDGYEEWIKSCEKKDLEYQMEDDLARDIIEDLNAFFSEEANYIINK